MIYVFDDYELDDEQYELRCAGELVSVEPKVFTMLAYLVQHHGRLVTKKELLEQLWPGIFVSESALTRCLTRARQVVRDDGVSQRVIKTVRGQGYRFVTAVEIGVVDAVQPAPSMGPLTDGLEDVPTTSTAAPFQHLCPRCQVVNALDRMFCATCGTMLVLTCPQCGFRNAPEAHFCGGCGALLSPLAMPQALALASLDSPSPPMRLGDQILASRATLAGERKSVTVLVVGLKGLSEIAHTVDPEVQHHLFNSAIQLMLREIHGVEGFVNQFTEQGLVALFGAPLAVEDHVLRALHAALGIQRVCTTYIAHVQQTEAIALDLGMGLHCGTVMVGTLGDDVRMTYTAQGFTLTLAHRLQEQAQQGAIYVSETIQKQAIGLFRFAALGMLAFHGLLKPVPIYACTGRGHMASRLESFLYRRVSRFLGRDAELNQLHTLWAKAQYHEGQVALLFGEAGMGKSRLAYEFRRSLARHPILEAQALSYGQQMPYHAFIPVLYSVLEINPSDPVLHQQHQLQEQLAAMHPPPTDDALFLASLLNIPWAEDAELHLTPEEQKRRLQQVCVQLILQQTVHAPVCLVVEDLHWLDDSSKELLDSLIAVMAQQPILLLCTTRPGFRHHWDDYTYFHRLTLTPLSTHQTTDLIRDFCHPHEVSEALTAFVLARTGGNPFFVEEILNALQEQGQLLLSDSTYTLAHMPTVPLPTSVQAIVAARIDQLPAAIKHLLQTAAVIGEEFPLWLLQTIADVPQEDLSRSLMHLQQAEFLHTKRLTPERTYTFKHVLTQEIAYDSLARERRRILHTRVLEALQDDAIDQVAVPVEQLAYHAQQAQAWQQAVHYLRQAGTQAMMRSAHGEAAQWFERALAALPHLPESRSTQELAIDLRFDLRTVLQPLGEFQRALDALHTAEPLAAALHDRRRLAGIAASMTFFYRAMGDHERAVACGQQALTLSDMLQDMALQTETCLYLGTAYHGLGRYQQALATFAQARATLARHPQQAFIGEVGIPTVLMHAYPIWSLAEVGAFDEGLALGQEGFRLANTTDSPYSLAMVSCAVGLLHLRQGAFATASAILEQALHLCQTRAVTAWIPGIASHLGYAYALSGRLAESVSLLQQAITASQHISGGHALWITWLGEALLLDRRVEEARAQAQCALTLARQRRERGHQAWGLWLLGAVALRGNPADLAQAEIYYQQALELADALMMPPLLAHCHMGLAMVYLHTGRQALASTELTAAIARFRDLGMVYWQLQAEAHQARLA